MNKKEFRIILYLFNAMRCLNGHFTRPISVGTDTMWP